MILDDTIKPFARAIYLNYIINVACMVLKINEIENINKDSLISSYEIIQTTNTKEIVKKMIDDIIMDAIEKSKQNTSKTEASDIEVSTNTDVITSTSDSSDKSYLMTFLNKINIFKLLF